MRWWLIAFSVIVVSGWMTLAAAEEGKTERILGGVMSGLLGAPQPAPDAAYLAQQQERLASLLQSGEYVTSRQGEPVELSILGVPLTRADHVYTATPVQPSQVQR